MSVVLVGGGPDTVTDAAVVAPFLDPLARRHERIRVAYVLFDADGSVDRFLPEYQKLLAEVSHEVVPVWASPGTVIEPRRFDDVDAVVVGGGPTPGYHASLRASYGAIRRLVQRGGPYLGFSAGAMIAPGQALLGGRRWQGRDVGPAEWSEGLDELSLEPGIGLCRQPVAVHVGQAGTLGTLVALIERGDVPEALGIDEDTSITIQPDGAWRAQGRGAVWHVRPAEHGALVERQVGT